MGRDFCAPTTFLGAISARRAGPARDPNNPPINATAEINGATRVPNTPKTSSIAYANAKTATRAEREQAVLNACLKETDTLSNKGSISIIDQNRTIGAIFDAALRAVLHSRIAYFRGRTVGTIAIRPPKRPLLLDGPISLASFQIVLAIA